VNIKKLETIVSEAKSSSFSLGTFSIAGSPAFPALVRKQEAVALTALQPLAAQLGSHLLNAESMVGFLDGWTQNGKALEALNTFLNHEAQGAKTWKALAAPISALTTHAPIMPRQVFCCGANYFKHVVDLIVDQGPGANPGTEGMDAVTLRKYAEDLMTRRKTTGAPYFFNKPVSSITGPNDSIVLPGFAKKPDWELELAVVIGKSARHVKRADALDYVAGYTIANDISNRDWIWARAEVKAMGTDWVAGKSCPTYLPLGPYIVPRRFVADPQDLKITLKLNGEVKQNESTSDMIFDVARQIEHLSSLVQLLPGDIICTGSPAGNGTHYNRFLQEGDLVESSISGLGSQHNPCVLERI
jgi:2-keto-4-pentenoate hydratase/2-oxohepta-3-ene-1,7-dioic acid hydratase in catechol pathway